MLHDKVLYNGCGLYRVTPQAEGLGGDELPPLRKISIAQIRHNLIVARLSLELVKRFDGKFIPERQLRHDLGVAKPGERKHISDGALELPDKRIAIEVELSTKGTLRLEKIIQEYYKDFNYKEVWYFCESGEVKNKITRLAEAAQFIKVFDIAEFMKIDKD